MATVIKSKQIIDGTGKDPISYGIIVIGDDGRIARVGKTGEFSLPADAEVIDAKDLTLLPGFIDAHSHASIIPGLGDQIGQMRQPPVPQTLRAVSNLRKDIKSGVTTMRVMGEEHFMDVELKKAINADQIPGPRLLISTRGLTASNGHGRALTVADGVQEVTKIARENLAAGADLIKIFVTGGVSSSTNTLDYCGYSREEIEAAVTEAARVGKKVAAHAHGGPGIRLCVESGVHSIEHGAFVTDKDLELMEKAGTWLVGTFSILFHPTGIEMTDFDVPAIREKALKARDAVRANWAKVFASGARFAVGTDSMHGLMPYEIQCLVDFGLSPMRAITAATSQAADLLGINDKTGTLEPGKLADIVGIEGDPLSDIKSLDNVRLVLKEGKRYDGISLL